MWKHIEKTVRIVLKGVIRAYQLLLSPVLGNNCRFHPNCSTYAVEAINHHGAMGGAWLAAKRITRCHPWHPGGFDPVPGQRCGVTCSKVGAVFFLLLGRRPRTHG